jgi:phosphatidate cytidylyltransferase
MPSLALVGLGNFELAWLLVALGALAASLAARLLGARPGDGGFGVIYIAAPCLALSWIRAQPNPISWTILLFAVVWSADICAFLVGNALKGPKLWPRYSPNKTWSGFFGGLLGAMGAAMLTAELSTAKLSLLAAAAIGLAGGLATMAGDLLESVLKRRFGVKDSGDLIPGHGGLFDRVDGLMVAVLAIAGARYIHQSGWVH